MKQDEEIDIQVSPTYKQHLAYEAINTPVLDPEDQMPLTVEVFFGGGADGGKSWFICESRLVNALRYPGYKSFIGRAELKRLMQSTYVTWLKVCAHYNIPRDEWRLDGALHVIRFRNGSTIDLLDLKYLPSEDPLYERYGSLEYSDGAIEEAGEVHPLAHEVMKTRVGRWKNKELGINPSILDTGNPKKNWTYHLFYSPWKKGELPPEVKFIQALHKDNQYGEQGYGKNLDRIKDEVTRARLRDGNWEYENDPSALIKYASIADLFTNSVGDDDTDDNLYMTADVARYGSDKTVVFLWKGWQVYKILWRELQGTDVTEEWLKGLARDEDIPYSHVMVDEDGIGGGVVDNMHGIRGFLAGASPVERPEDADEDEEILTNKPEQRRAFANVKTQCAYYAARKVNKHQASVRTNDVQIREWLTNDLEQIKEQNVDSEDKRQLVPKEEVKIVLRRSPDFGDNFIMRALFDLKPPKKPQQAWQRRHTPQRRG